MFFVFALCAFSFGAAVVVDAQTSALAPCTFSGNLEVGTVSEEVRCVQKFLNDHGFKIAEVGVGSPGKETGMYGELTKEAVKKWQQENGITPTGTFGPLSQEKYLKYVASLLTTQLSNLGSTGGDTVVTPTTPAPVPAVDLNAEKREKARDLILDARDIIEKAEDDVDDADSNEIDKENAADDISDAKDDLLDALYAFVDEDYEDAIDLAEDVIKNINDDIMDELHGDDSDAEEALQDAEDAIDEARDEIDAAYDDGDDVDEANDLLDDAEDKFDDAQEAFDDEDYEEAEDLANEAEDLANDAVDAIGN